MCSWLLVALASAQSLVYVPGPSGVADAQFSTWNAGQRLFVGVDGANLRASAPDGDVVAELPLATEVTIVAPVGEPTVAIGRRNQWYRVTAGDVEGVLFGSLLTPFGGHAREVTPGPESWLYRAEPDWAVVFSPEFQPRLRFRRGEALVEVDVVPTERFSGGELDVRFSRYAEGNRPQFEVTLCATRPITDVPRCVTARVDDEGRRVGPVDEWRFVPVEAPDGHVAETMVATRWPGGDVAGTTQGECVAVATGAGRFEGLPIVRCDLFEGGEKGGWDQTVSTFYAVRSPTEWVRLRGPSTIDLAARSIRQVDWPTHLAGVLEQPDALTHEGQRWRATGVDPGRTLGPAFDHPLGAVRRTTRGLVLSAPAGELHYALDPAHVTLDGSVYTTGAGYGCGQSDVLFREEHIAMDDLEQVVPSSELGPVYRLTRADHPVIERLQGSHPRVAADDWRFVADAWGGVIRLEALGQEHMLQCEPFVYVYGDREVEVTVEATTQVWAVHPPFDEGQTWTVRARPDGVRLFWEGQSASLPRPSEGWVVRGAALEAFLTRLLPSTGLRGREVHDLVRLVGPDHREAPWVRIGWHRREAIDRAAPLTVRPPPDTLVRVLLELEDLERPEVIVPPALTASERGAEAVAEWGVVERWRPYE